MATSDGYGQRLGQRLRVENAPAIVTRALRKADMAVTEIRCDDPLPGITGSIQTGRCFSGRFAVARFSHASILGGWPASAGLS